MCYVADAPTFVNELRIVHHCLTTELDASWHLVVFGPSSLKRHATLRKVWDCTRVRFFPMTGSNGPHGDYPYLNSIEMFATETSAMATLRREYTHLLRSDTDVFLTSTMNSWDLPPNTLAVGQGGYDNSDAIRERIVRVAKLTSSRVGLAYRKTCRNIGSTWYGRTEDVIDTGRIAYRASLVALSLCPPGPFGAQIDDWHANRPYKGVSTMYGGDVAVNHGVHTGRFHVTKALRLDTPSHLLQVRKPGHIHCWHDPKRFDKHAFQQRKYRASDVNIAAPKTDLPLRDWCLRMAYEACPEMFSA